MSVHIQALSFWCDALSILCVIALIIIWAIAWTIMWLPAWYCVIQLYCVADWESIGRLWIQPGLPPGGGLIQNHVGQEPCEVGGSHAWIYPYAKCRPVWMYWYTLTTLYALCMHFCHCSKFELNRCKHQSHFLESSSISLMFWSIIHDCRPLQEL